MSFASVVSSILHIGEDVAPEVASSLFSPAAGALVTLVLNGVTNAEQTGNSTGQTIQDLIPAATGILNSVMQAKGASVAIDPAQRSTALAQMATALGSLAGSVTPASTASGAASAAA